MKTLRQFFISAGVFLTPVLVFAADAVSPATSPNSPTVKVDLSSNLSTLRKVKDWILETLTKYSLQVLAGIIILVIDRKSTRLNSSH